MKNKTQIRLLQGSRLIDAARPQRHVNHAGELTAVNRLLRSELDGHVCRKPIIVLPGTGRKTFPLPNLAQLIEACVAHINKAAAEQRARVQSQRSRSKAAAGDDTGSEGIKELIEGFSLPEIHGIISAATMPVANPHGGTLFLAAGGLAESMYDGRFEEHLAPIFDPPLGIEEWAGRHMPEKFQETVQSLRLHWQEIYKLFVGEDELSKSHVAGALPSVMHAVAANFPQAGEDEVISAAVSVICKALAQIMGVLRMWDSSFAQQRDGKYTELMYVTYTLEQCFKLMTANANIETMVMHVGDVYMPRYSGSGPATIPGARGPLHAHLIEVPFNMRRQLITDMPVFTHEFRHDVYADIAKLPVQMAQAVLDSIDRNAANYKFSSDTVMLGGQAVPTLELLKQIYVQTLSETDADIAGGVLLTGPSFLYSMITVFSALNSMGKSILNEDVLLRSNSHFGIDMDNGQPELVFAPHMPDYPRAYVVAASLDVLGFKDEAQECRILSDQAAGDKKPQFVIWTNGDRSDKKFKFAIKVRFDDLIQVAPAVADAIINTKLECLGDRSMGELVYFDQHKQGKVARLADLLVAGQSELPADIGDVFATYIAAAAITAYWSLCKAGMRPRKALAQVETCARKMLDEVIKRDVAAAQAKPAPVPAQPSDDGEKK